jgi:hypothetical protein
LFSAFEDQVSHVGIYAGKAPVSVALRYTSIDSAYGAWTPEIDFRKGQAVGNRFEMEASTTAAYADGVAILNLRSAIDADVWVAQRKRDTDELIAESQLGDLAPGHKLLTVLSGLFEPSEGTKYTIEARNEGATIQVVGLSFFGADFFNTTLVQKK